MSQYLSKIVDLLNRLDGTEVISSFFADNVFRIEFQITDAGSRYLIHKISEAANINVQIYINHQIGGDELLEEPDKGLMYRFNSYGTTNANDQMCWIGAHFTWALFQSGVLCAKEEKELCEIFGARSRSA